MGKFVVRASQVASEPDCLGFPAQLCRLLCLLLVRQIPPHGHRKAARSDQVINTWPRVHIRGIELPGNTLIRLLLWCGSHAHPGTAQCGRSNVMQGLVQHRVMCFSSQAGCSWKQCPHCHMEEKQCTSSACPVLRSALRLIYCSALIETFLIIVKQGTPGLHFALGPANYVANHR